MFLERTTSMVPKDGSGSVVNRGNSFQFIDENNIRIGLFAKNHAVNIFNHDCLNESRDKLSEQGIMNSSIDTLSGIVEGGVSSVCSNLLTLSIRKLGSSLLLLKLVEASESPNILYLSISFLVSAISKSEHLLKDIEDGNYYEVLAYILSTKSQILSTAVIDILLELVGYHVNKPFDAKIANFDAYTHIFLNPRLWTLSNDMTIYYLQHFKSFIVSSRFKVDNIRKILVS